MEAGGAMAVLYIYNMIQRPGRQFNSKDMKKSLGNRKHIKRKE